jgi:hypothetical protein
MPATSVQRATPVLQSRRHLVTADTKPAGLREGHRSIGTSANRVTFARRSMLTLANSRTLIDDSLSSAVGANVLRANRKGSRGDSTITRKGVFSPAHP